jgi:RHS repeat-associated protein
LRTLRGEHALQDLSYTFDPVGNITDLRDDAQQTIFFRNRAVEPNAGYTYDALYRLIEATGREHLGQGGGPEPTSPTDAPRVGLPQPGDGDAMGRYLERYVYDEVGNFLQMIHRGSDPSNPGWTRAYTYDEPSQLEPDRVSNRLTSTAIGDHTAEAYTYDAHGNMTAMPHLSSMQWDFKDQLQAVARQATGDGVTPETTYYVYDGAGQRVRKVTERSHSALRSKERLYLGGFEVYREYEGDGSTVSLERETLHVMDGQQRVALIETRTQGSDPAPAQLIRYQMSNHLGSATLELDIRAQIISYEEYYPYGSTSYQAVRSRTETPKRYRYTGKERDEESGFSYHGARYFAPWLGRWTSCDPKNLSDGSNLYAYTGNNPILYVDPAGTDRQKADASVGYAESNVVGTNSSAKVEYQFPETVSFKGATDDHRTFSGLNLQGAAVSGGNSLLSPGSRKLSHLYLGASANVKLAVEWRPQSQPLSLDVSLHGTSDFSSSAGIQAKFWGSATLNLDFDRLGVFRISTPLKLELQAQLTPAGIGLKASYEYGSWYAHSAQINEGLLTYSEKEGLHAIATKSTVKSYGIGFYDRPASQLVSDSRPLAPSLKYSTGSLSRTEPFAPDSEGRLEDKHVVETQHYVGIGYRKQVTVVGKSRLEYSASFGIGINANYLPDSIVISGTMKYDWW